MTRRIPYYFAVTRPALETVAADPDADVSRPATPRRRGSRVSVYRSPASPFGPPPDYTGASMREDGAEKLYSIPITSTVANFGVSVISTQRERAASTRGCSARRTRTTSRDTRGRRSTSTRSRSTTASTSARPERPPPRPKTYYVAVDSGRDRSRASLLGGPVHAPLVGERRVPAARPASHHAGRNRQADARGPRDRRSIRRARLGRRPAVARDRVRQRPRRGRGLRPGLRARGLPAAGGGAGPAAGRTPTTIVASDYQEAKNVNTSGAEIMPNTAFRASRITVVAKPAVTWLSPSANRARRRRRNCS